MTRTTDRRGAAVSARARPRRRPAVVRPGSPATSSRSDASGSSASTSLPLLVERRVRHHLEVVELARPGAARREGAMGARPCRSTASARDPPAPRRVLKNRTLSRLRRLGSAVVFSRTRTAGTPSSPGARRAPAGRCRVGCARCDGGCRGASRGSPGLPTPRDLRAQLTGDGAPLDGREPHGAVLPTPEREAPVGVAEAPAEAHGVGERLALRQDRGGRRRGRAARGRARSRTPPRTRACSP